MHISKTIKIENVHVFLSFQLVALKMDNYAHILTNLSTGNIF
jgi:hypothetical protein